LLRAELESKNTLLIEKTGEIDEITAQLQRYTENCEAGELKIDIDDKLEEKLVSIKEEKGKLEIKEKCYSCKEIESTEIKLLKCSKCKIIK